MYDPVIINSPCFTRPGNIICKFDTPEINRDYEPY